MQTVDDSPRAGSATESSPARKRRRLLPWLVAATVLVVLAAAPFLVRSYHIARVPYRDHPFDLEQYGTVEVAPEDNAHEDFAAAAALGASSPWELDEHVDVDNTIAIGWQESTPGVHRLLNSNEAALVRFRNGCRKQRMLSDDVDADPDVVYAVSNLGELNLVDAARLSSSSDHAGAWERIRETLCASRIVRSSGYWRQRSATLEMFGTCLVSVRAWAVRDTVDGPLLRRGLEQFRAECSRTPPLSEMVRSAYFEFADMMDGMNVGEVFEPHRNPTISGFEYWVLGEPEYSMHCVRHMVANWLSECDKPYVQRKRRAPTETWLYDVPSPVAGEMDATGIDVAVRKSEVAMASMPRVYTAFPYWDLDLCNRALIEALLALRITRVETGRYPARWEELVAAGLLPQVPVDPLSPTGDPLRFSIDADGHLSIWSVGENGIDDKRRTDHLYEPLDIVVSTHPPKRREHLHLPAESDVRK